LALCACSCQAPQALSRYLWVELACDLEQQEEVEAKEPPPSPRPVMVLEPEQLARLNALSPDGTPGAKTQTVGLRVPQLGLDDFADRSQDSNSLIGLNERWSLEFFMGVEPELVDQDTALGSDYDPAIADLVLSLSWIYGLSARTALKGSVAAARTQDMNFTDAIEDAEFAWLTVGLQFQF